MQKNTGTKTYSNDRTYRYDVPTDENTKTKPPDYQPTKASPREVTNISQDTAPVEQNNNEERHDTGPAE